MVSRGAAAANCPSAVGVTIPRLLDDTRGTFDFLYRADPFRVCIVDIDGRIAYHSPDGMLDFQSDTLDQVIAKPLDALLAHDGKLTDELLAQGRCDAVGKPAVGCWLPRVEYFSLETPLKPPVKKGAKAPAAGSLVKIDDARGYVLQVPKETYAALQKKRTLIARLFTLGEKPSPRPVALIFTGPTPANLTASAAALESFYQRCKGKADIYLVYAGKDANLKARAAAAATWLKAGKLTIPCLLDDLENAISYAYAAETGPRVYLISRDAKGVAVVQYVSQAYAADPATALAAVEPLLPVR